jgi:hypothetical protein
MGRVVQLIMTLILVPAVLYAVDFPLWGTMTGEEENTRFGRHMADIGDVNRDGYHDLAATDSWFPGGGKVYIWFGGEPFDTVCDVPILAPQGALSFGASLAGTGDINGDGFDDFLIGAPSSHNGGYVYAFYGGDPPDTEPDIVINPPEGIRDNFGYQVVAGDLNNDTYADWVIMGYNSVSELLVYYGPDYEDTIPDKILYGHNSVFGAYGLLIHELNGDQYDDLVVGAGGVSQGRCFIYWGADTLSDTWQWEDTTTGPFSAGDINGDGLEDLHTDMGIYLGPVDADTLLDYYFPPVGISRHEGGTGYFNNDRFADVLIKASHVWPETHLAMYLGSPDFDLEVDWEDNRDWGFGSPSMSINLNADVVDDFVTASWGSSRGRVWVYGGDTTTVIGVEDESAHDLPSALFLSAYPNPFNSSAVIEFSVTGGPPVSSNLKIYNSRGELVKTLMEMPLIPGRYHYVWDGTNSCGEGVTSGVYFISLRAGDVQRARKALLIR